MRRWKDRELIYLPQSPMIVGRIRWAKAMGEPARGTADAFRVLLEEHTPTQFRVGPGGIEAIPGTGVWKTLDDDVRCRSYPDDGDRHVAGFTVHAPHLNVLPDGAYRLTPRLAGKWHQAPVQIVIGYKRIEPSSWSVTLLPGQHVQTVNFDVVARSWLFGFR